MSAATARQVAAGFPTATSIRVAGLSATTRCECTLCTGRSVRRSDRADRIGSWIKPRAQRHGQHMVPAHRRQRTAEIQAHRRQRQIDLAMLRVGIVQTIAEDRQTNAGEVPADLVLAVVASTSRRTSRGSDIVFAPTQSGTFATSLSPPRRGPVPRDQALSHGRP